MREQILSFISRNREILIVSTLGIFIFSLIFSDVLFFGRTLRGEPYASGVLPLGQAFYEKEGIPNRSHIDDPGASAWNNNPPFKIAIDQIKEGFTPWWNPFNGTGTPLLASLQSGVMFPPKLAILFFNPSPFFFDLYTIFRLFIAFIFTYLFIRLHRINPLVGFIAGFSFALSGSLLRYVNLEHLNIDAFIPFYLFSLELFLQQKTFKRWLLFTGSLALMILGGFPEASLFAFILATTYFLFRWWEQEWGLKLFVQWVSANFAAFFICFPIILPFLVNIADSWTIHEQVGNLALPVSVLFALITPHLFRPFFMDKIGIPLHTLIPGWIGVTIILLASMALFFKGKNYRVGFFFAFFGLIAILKEFGFILINWIGYLPLLNKAIFFKYVNPSLTFSLVVASAFSVQNFVSNKVTKIQLFAALAGMTLFTAIFLSASIRTFVDVDIQQNNFFLQFNYLKQLAFFSFIVFLGILVVTLTLFTSLSVNKRLIRLLLPFILLLICFEVLISLPTSHPKRDRGYPSVSFLSDLKKRLGNDFRLSGKDNVLFPVFSGVYQLKDPRLLDAMYLKSYYKFITTVDPTIHDRFTNIGNSWFQNPATLKVMGVKYILATSNLENTATITDFERLYALKKGVFNLNNQVREVNLLDGNFNKTFLILIPKETSEIYFYFGVHQKAWEGKSDNMCLNVLTQFETKRTCINTRNLADREWKRVNLAVKENTELRLTLKVDRVSNSTSEIIGITELYSVQELNQIEETFTVTDGFPIKQNGVSIFSYTVKDAKKIAFFPERVTFVNEENFVSETKSKLEQIDQEVIAVGKNNDQIQNNKIGVEIKSEINGNMLLTLEEGHPKYLYVSQPQHKNLQVKNDKGVSLKWFKANIGFILIDTENSREVKITQSPNTTIKIILGSGFVLGIIIVFISFLRWKK